MSRLRTGPFLWSLLLTITTLSAQEPKSAKPLTLIDAAGKEIGLKGWKFTGGTKQLSWLDGKEPIKGAKPAGPEFLEFREQKAVMYKDDVTTYIPLAALKELVYEPKSKVVTVTLAAGDGKDLTLRGTTNFVGINKFNLDGEVTSGTLNVAGPVSLLDGSLRADIRAIRFPDPIPDKTAFLPDAVVSVRGKEKARHEVQGLRPLYRKGAGNQVMPYLMFQKTVKVELKDLARMRHLPAKDKKGGLLDFEVEKQDGTKQGLTLLTTIDLGEKNTAVLVGLVGQVAAGYRLFPATIIEEVTWKGKDKEDK